MKGREIDVWERAVTSLPVEQMLQAIIAQGFDGIYIDRQGFTDRASALETQLSALLKTQPFVSRNQRLAFFRFSADRSSP